ncbi:MAG: hypothetical protein U0264_15600 [Candidatus Kapaibacterium sp.]
MTKYILTLAFLVMTIVVSAQIPKTMSFQGQLIGSDSKPVPAGNYKVTLQLFDSPTVNSVLWEQTLDNVVVNAAGLFTITMTGLDKLYNSQSELLYNKQLYLGMKYASGAIIAEIPKRIPLTSSPYAFMAEHVMNFPFDTTKPINGQVLKWKDNQWVPGQDSVGSGSGGIGIKTITSNDSSLKVTITNDNADLIVDSISLNRLMKVGATKDQVLKFDGTTWKPGTELTSVNFTAEDPITLNGTVISLKKTGVKEGQILKFTSGKWDAGTDLTTGTPTPYTGTAPIKIDGNNKISIDNTGATAGQVLKYNGTSWTPAPDSVGGGVNNFGVSSVNTRTGDIVLKGGTNVTIAESPNGTFTIDAKSGGGGSTPDTLKDKSVTTKKLEDGKTKGDIINWDGAKWEIRNYVDSALKAGWAKLADSARWALISDSTKKAPVQVPVGTVVAYYGTEFQVPSDWLICDGRKTLGYPALIAHLTTLGVDATKTPDLRGQFLRGTSFTSEGLSDKDPQYSNRTGTGAKIGSSQDDTFQGHWHKMENKKPGDNGGSTSDGYSSNDQSAMVLTLGPGNYGQPQYWRASTITSDAITGDGPSGTPRTSSETRPKNVYVNYIIKAK